jgi:Tol biopolymer transport system component
MLRRAGLAALASLALSCGDQDANPFAANPPSRPPSADAAIMFVSGSWSAQPAAPRELMAIAADGSNPQQLTSCARAEEPCDFLQIATSAIRDRVIAVRTTPSAEPGTQVLYFIDLTRSVESVVLPRRRVDSADWSRDGSLLLFASAGPQTSNEDLFTSNADGSNEINITQSATVRERRARLDPAARTAAFERIGDDGVSRVYLYRDTPLATGASAGPPLAGTPYLVGSDADPAFSPDSSTVVFRRLTGTGNGGLGTWDLLTIGFGSSAVPRTIASGPIYRGAPDWGRSGIVFVETDAQTARSQLVVIQPDGSGRTVLRSENAAARMASPRWLP